MWHLANLRILLSIFEKVFSVNGICACLTPFLTKRSLHTVFLFIQNDSVFFTHNFNHVYLRVFSLLHVYFLPVLLYVKTSHQNKGKIHLSAVFISSQLFTPSYQVTMERFSLLRSLSFPLLAVPTHLSSKKKDQKNLNHIYLLFNYAALTKSGCIFLQNLKRQIKLKMYICLISVKEKNSFVLICSLLIFIQCPMHVCCIQTYV